MSFASCMMRWRVKSLIGYSLLCKARDAVDAETPAALAISSKVVGKDLFSKLKIITIFEQTIALECAIIIENVCGVKVNSSKIEF